MNTTDTTRSCIERRSTRSFDKTQSEAADERGAKASIFYIEVCRGAQGSLSHVDGFHARCFARLTRTERRLGSTATAGAGASGELSRCGVCM